jgi:hypothetical protein
MMADRSIRLTHTTILRWVQHYLPEFEKRWGRYARSVGGPFRKDIYKGWRTLGLPVSGDARFLPATAASELSKAMSRLASNDESGAVTAACGAVDATASALYQKHNFGEPPGSFQSKVNTALNRLRVFEKLEQELIEVGVQPGDAHKIADEIHQATKHAVEALQVVRRTTGDVHGTKPTYTRLVYDSIKWSSAMVSLRNTGPFGRQAI